MGVIVFGMGDHKVKVEGFSETGVHNEGSRDSGGWQTDVLGAEPTYDFLGVGTMYLLLKEQ